MSPIRVSHVSFQQNYGKLACPVLEEFFVLHWMDG